MAKKLMLFFSLLLILSIALADTNSVNSDNNYFCGRTITVCPPCPGGGVCGCNPPYTDWTYNSMQELTDDNATLLNTGPCEEPCTTEGQSMPVYPGYSCCSGLNPITTTGIDASGAIVPLVGASICSKCGNETCEKWENNVNCPSDCKIIDDGGACTKEYIPVCGAVTTCPACQSQTPACLLPCTLEKKTFGNECVAKSAGATVLYKGECPTPSDSCICTMEYNPQCGSDGVTYGNPCGAKCAGVAIDYAGECKSPEGKFCGGIAGIQCPSGYECKLDGDYPDAGGKCVLKNPDCPSYVMPLCAQGKHIEKLTNYDGCSKPVCVDDNCSRYDMLPCQNGKIYSILDSKGCPVPKCTNTDPLPTTGDFYKSASWTCSNGKVFKESENTCTPYSAWKEKARNTCMQLSTKCGVEVPVATSASSGGGSSATSASATITGNILVTAATAQTTTTNTTVSSTSAVAPTQVATSTAAKCVGGEVYVSEFSVSDQCRPECQSYMNPNGCKITRCSSGEETINCANVECKDQPYEEIKILKDKCYAANGQVVVNFDGICSRYACISSTSTSVQASGIKDENKSNQCLTIAQIPQEKIDYCEQNGGKFVSKENENGCLVVAQCVGETNSPSAITPINTKIIADQTQLLALAIKLETLKIELGSVQEKLIAIGNYYAEHNDINSSTKFFAAAEKLTDAISIIEGLKINIKENVSNFSEDNAKDLREAIREIKNTLLKEVLLTILG